MTLGRMNRPRASVVVVEYDSAAYLRSCLRALEASTLPRAEFEIIVVDNASPTPPDALRDPFPRVHWIKCRRNLGFAGGCTLGLDRARGDIVLSVNPDCVVDPDWLSAMLEPFNDPSVGVVGCKLLYAGTSVLQHAGGLLFPNGRSEHRGRGEPDRGQYDQMAEVDYVCGAAFAVRRGTIDEVGFLSPAYFPAYYEETELCVRARRAGWKVVYTPHAVAQHHESVASGGPASETYLRRYHESRIRFVYRNGSVRRWLTTFVPAELAWLRSVSATERAICARAYVTAFRDAWRTDRGTPRLGDVVEEVFPRTERRLSTPPPHPLQQNTPDDSAPVETG